MTNIINQLNRITIVTGHYGTGKTNLAINLAVDLKKQNPKQSVKLVDIDIVNPYFRSADFVSELGEKEIEVVAPMYANTNVDIPAITFGIAQAIEDTNSYVILDVGGDDAGAAVLGRYADYLTETGYTMLNVVNCFRYLTQTVEQTVENLREVEYASHLFATHIVNNSHLCNLTTPKDILKGSAYAKKVADLAAIPLLFTAVERTLTVEVEDKYPIDIYVKNI